jgi:glutamate synthase (NADPH) small chain
MDCGIPFCNTGCPLGNLIPDWNDLVYRDHWREAIERLHATNNFPEFTGRLCPRRAKAACVLGINQPPVTIKQVEVEIIDRAFSEGWVEAGARGAPDRQGGSPSWVRALPASPPPSSSPVRVTTSSCSSATTVIGGLLRYGIPEFKMEKRHSTVASTRCGPRAPSSAPVSTSASTSPPRAARADFDAVVLAGGATVRRDLPIPGRELDGIHQAMEYLPIANRVQEGDLDEPTITAEGKRVVIIGGGDTGADCLGTAHRQGAASVHQFEIMPRPPDERAVHAVADLALMFRTACRRPTKRAASGLLGQHHRVRRRRPGRLRGLRGVEVTSEVVDGRPSFVPVPDSEFELPCELVLLAMGFTGAEREGLLEQLGVGFDARGNVARDDWMSDVDGVFVCGDMGRGQSLIVWAIAEGRSCAAAVDTFLEGTTELPTAIRPGDRPIS